MLRATTGKLDMTLTAFNCRRRVTIPDAGARLLDLVSAAMPAGFDAAVVAVRILPRLPDGSDRQAFTVADPLPGAAIQPTDYTTHGELVLPGEGWTTDSVGDLDAYVKAAGGIPAIVVIHW